MRTIEISTEVFAKIWAQRMGGEEDEDAILKRLLGVFTPNSAKFQENSGRSRENASALTPIQSQLWRNDVKSALEGLDGQAHLKQIYDAVRNIRRRSGRSVPANLEAIVRRELEYNSSDASSFQGRRDWFRSVEGIGSGIWAIRSEAKP